MLLNTIYPLSFHPVPIPYPPTDPLVITPPLKPPLLHDNTRTLSHKAPWPVPTIPTPGNASKNPPLSSYSHTPTCTLVIAYANTDGFSLLKWCSLLTPADEHDIDIFLVVETHLGPGATPSYIQRSGWVALSAPGIPQGASHHGQFRAGLILLYRHSADLTATISQHHGTDNRTLLFDSSP